VLPAYGVTVRRRRRGQVHQVLRGYKTSEVDWVLDRLARELEALRGQLAAVHASSVAEKEADAEGDAVEPEDGEDRQDTV